MDAMSGAGTTSCPHCRDEVSIGMDSDGLCNHGATSTHGNHSTAISPISWLDYIERASGQWSTLTNDLGQKLMTTSDGMESQLPMCHEGMTSQLSPGCFYSSPINVFEPLIRLPGFIKPLPSTIGIEDALYLHVKGALSLPSLPLQNSLLDAFVDYIHNELPVIDLLIFLESVQSRDGSKSQVSLLLYQAVMLAACTVVDIEHLYESGYSSRRDAQDEFFYQARLLYDLGYESDNLAVIQALLLMSYRQGPGDNSREDGWYWMGVAISLAYATDLHRIRSNKRHYTWGQGLRRRVWWSCLTRERLIALGTKRPMRIRDEDFDVPVLEENDFDHWSLPEHITIVSPKCKIIRSTKLQQDVAKIFIAKTRLCIHLGPGSGLEMPLSESISGVDTATLVDQDLMAWAEGLPATCQYRTITTIDIQTGQSVIAVQRTFLHMLYYTAIILIHRKRFLPGKSTWASQTRQLSRLRVREAVLKITQMADSMHKFQIDRYLPPTGVTVLLSAIAMHVLRMKHGTGHPRQYAIQGFHQCMRVLKELRKFYARAEDAIQYLDALSQKRTLTIKSPAGQSSAQE